MDDHAEYARACLADSLRRGEAPFLPHLLYPQALGGTKGRERDIAREAGASWRRAADLVALYTDYGISPGMAAAKDHAHRCGIPVEIRSLTQKED